MRLGPFEVQYVGWKPQSVVRGFRSIQELIWLSRADKEALKAARAHAYNNGEWNLIFAIKAYRVHSGMPMIGLMEAKEHCQKLLRRYGR